MKLLNYFKDHSLTRGGKIKEVELAFMNSLIRNIMKMTRAADLVERTLEKMLAGEYLKLQDGGLFYHEMIQEFPNHFRAKNPDNKFFKGKEYHFRGSVMSKITLSLSQDKDYNEYTWIKFERHGKGVFKTLIDALKYFANIVTCKPEQDSIPEELIEIGHNRFNGKKVR